VPNVLVVEVLGLVREFGWRACASTNAGYINRICGADGDDAAKTADWRLTAVAGMLLIRAGLHAPNGRRIWKLTGRSRCHSRAPGAEPFVMVEGRWPD
jgi:hypothetical protein